MLFDVVDYIFCRKRSPKAVASSPPTYAEVASAAVLAVQPQAPPPITVTDTPHKLSAIAAVTSVDDGENEVKKPIPSAAVEPLPSLPLPQKEEEFQFVEPKTVSDLIILFFFFFFFAIMDSVVV